MVRLSTLSLNTQEATSGGAAKLTSVHNIFQAYDIKRTMAGLATHERDRRIAEGKGDFQDKLPIYGCLVSFIMCIIYIIFLVATGKKNQVGGFAKEMTNMFSKM